MVSTNRPAQLEHALDVLDRLPLPAGADLEQLANDAHAARLSRRWGGATGRREGALAVALAPLGARLRARAERALATVGAHLGELEDREAKLSEQLSDVATAGVVVASTGARGEVERRERSCAAIAAQIAAARARSGRAGLDDLERQELEELAAAIAAELRRRPARRRASTRRGKVA